jgi:hypothetical protein
VLPDLYSLKNNLNHEILTGTLNLVGSVSIPFNAALTTILSRDIVEVEENRRGFNTQNTACNLDVICMAESSINNACGCATTLLLLLFVV